MLRLLALTCLFWGLLTLPLSAQTREEKVRNDKKKVEAEGYWIYNDVPKAFEEAKKSGKPIITVLRCLPCEECVKLDDELIEADNRIKPLLEKFVRLRVVSTNGLDLSLFQFDTDQSFAVFFFNADRELYGRFGTRSDRTEWIGDVSIDGLAEAMKGALDLHGQMPQARTGIAKKLGPKPLFSAPEKLPNLERKYTSKLDYEGKVVQSCIHCHQIGDAIRERSIQKTGTLPDQILFPYPHPKILGLVMDPKQRATVQNVEPGSLAEKFGFQAGDQIQSLDGQPLLSLADIQWVLNQGSNEGAEIPAIVTRAGKAVQMTLKLPKGWRDLGDISWRASTWQLRRIALGGMYLVNPSDELRTKYQLPKDSTALLVQHVGQYAPHDVAHRGGVRKGDILLGINGRTDLLRETDIIATRIRERKPGDKIALNLLRDGKKVQVEYTLP